MPEINAEAKVIAVDVNENVIVYGNDDFVEKFETNKGIIRTRYFLRRRKILSKVRGRQLRERLLEKYRGREWRRIREIYYRVAKKIISKALEVGPAVIVMEDLRHLNERIWAPRSLMGECIDRVTGDSSRYWIMRRSFMGLT